MHVGFRTSGGRGEYELVGQHEGTHASEVSGWTLSWIIPSVGRRDTNLWVDPGMSGKPRLRAHVRNWPQIGRQVGALLLLPSPVRTRSTSLPGGFSILRANGYWLHKVGFRPDTVLDRTGEEIQVRPAYVEVSNSSESAILGFDSRWARVQEVHRRVGSLPAPLAEAVAAHEASLADSAVGSRTIRAAQRLYEAMAATDQVDAKRTDALEVLEGLLGVTPDSSPGVPAIDEISPDDVEARLRSASEMRLAKARGQTARVFSQQVRAAYDHTCAFCGLRLPTMPGVLSGVDAAHILAWSDYDLDVVTNGICLCKTHHWAFDQAILAVRYRHAVYVVEETPRVEMYTQTTQGQFRRILGPIPESRLPMDESARPSPHYLARLYEDIDVTLSP